MCCRRQLYVSVWLAGFTTERFKPATPDCGWKTETACLTYWPTFLIAPSVLITGGLIGSYQNVKRGLIRLLHFFIFLELLSKLAHQSEIIGICLLNTFNEFIKTVACAFGLRLMN